MSRTLSTATRSRKHFRILEAGLAIALIAGCGSSGNGGDDVATGGAGVRYNTGGGGGVIYLSTGTRNVIPTGGRTGTGVPQGGASGAATGGAITTSTCITGTLNCSCYSSGACASGLICNTSKTICVRDTSVGGATAAGGSQATGGASGGGSTAVSGSSATGGSTAAGGSQTTGGATAATGGSQASGGTAATGGSQATGGASSGTSGGSTGTGVAHDCADLTTCCTRLTDNQALCFTVVAAASTDAVCDTMWRQFGC